MRQRFRRELLLNSDDRDRGLPASPASWALADRTRQKRPSPQPSPTRARVCSCAVRRGRGSRCNRALVGTAHEAIACTTRLIVENVTGAGGTIAVGRVARAAPDGYTLSLGNNGSHVVTGATYAIHYDLLNDFEPIALLSTAPSVLVARRRCQPMI